MIKYLLKIKIINPNISWLHIREYHKICLIQIQLYVWSIQIVSNLNIFWLHEINETKEEEKNKKDRN